MKKQEKLGRFPWTVSWFLTWFQKSPVRKFVTSSKGNETGWIIKRSKTQRFNSESIQILSTDNAIEYSIIYIYLLYIYIQYIYNILQFIYNIYTTYYSLTIRQLVSFCLFIFLRDLFIFITWVWRHSNSQPVYGRTKRSWVSSVQFENENDVITM